MRDSLYLYQLAEKKDIPILPFPLPETGSLCVQEEGGSCCIGVDEALLSTESEKKTHLAHELGHCLTGSFYNRYAPCDVRQKHENRANKWALRRLIPRRELEAALAAGHTEVWDLAEQFSVTEDFMRLALSWYLHGNLDPEQ